MKTTCKWVHIMNSSNCWNYCCVELINGWKANMNFYWYAKKNGINVDPKGFEI